MSPVDFRIFAEIALPLILLAGGAGIAEMADTLAVCRILRDFPS